MYRPSFFYKKRTDMDCIHSIGWRITDQVLIFCMSFMQDIEIKKYIISHKNSREMSKQICLKTFHLEYIHQIFPWKATRVNLSKLSRKYVNHIYLSMGQYMCDLFNLILRTISSNLVKNYNIFK